METFRRFAPRHVAGLASVTVFASPDGDGYALVCAPENEAAIYAEALTLNLWPRAQEFGGPVKLIGADPNAKGAPATAQTIQYLPTISRQSVGAAPTHGATLIR